MSVASAAAHSATQTIVTRASLGQAKRACAGRRRVVVDDRRRMRAFPATVRAPHGKLARRDAPPDVADDGCHEHDRRKRCGEREDGDEGKRRDQPRAPDA
jgi:hypothetical protein